VKILTSLFATRTGILTSDSSSSPYDLPSSYYGTLPYQTQSMMITTDTRGSQSPASAEAKTDKSDTVGIGHDRLQISTASVLGLAPLDFRRGVTRPVSYYTLFKGMATSKPTSWLFQQLHILYHLA